MREKLSGLQQFLDNFIYAVMVCKMVNMVAQQGNYWIVNNFIWGWLLIPVSVLGEVIRSDCKDGCRALRQFNCYFIAAASAAPAPSRSICRRSSSCSASAWSCTMSSRSCRKGSSSAAGFEAPHRQTDGRTAQCRAVVSPFYCRFSRFFSERYVTA